MTVAFSCVQALELGILSRQVGGQADGRQAGRQARET